MDIEKYIKNGVVFRSLVDVVIDDEVIIERGTVIDSGNHILGATTIGKNCILEQGNVIENANIGDNTTIIKSVIKKATIGKSTTVGPFAHVHTNSVIRDNCRIGNFVEIKNATIGNHTKVAHLAYVGDADVGNYCNVGCGAIFVNYDGKNKHRSTVGDSVFIGSNSNIIAPVNLYNNAYIAAGTTVTVDLPSDCLCIGRKREVIKENRSKYHKKPIKKYFGTDGIRGKYKEFLTEKMAFMVGNYLGYSSTSGKIVVGRDNRTSGEILSISLKEGIISAGADVIDLGIVPTPCVAYATTLEDANYGIVITASHNPPEYNGIKIFNFDGHKLSDIEELEIESFIDKNTPYYVDTVGNAILGDYLVQNYLKHLKTVSHSFDGQKVVLDCANGATSRFAPDVFYRLGASTVALNKSTDGTYINDNCGALHPEKSAERVLAVNADVGYTFDGDGDRLIAIDEKGTVVDGDEIIYIIAKYLKENGLLNNDVVVGTTMTNMGIEKALNALGITLIRAEVGDHHVMEEMLKAGAVLGGEQSGHIIVSTLAGTGDGIQTAVLLSHVIKSCGVPLSSLKTYTKYPQLNASVTVKDKVSVMKDAQLTSLITQLNEKLEHNSRIIVRASGTEPKIRVMVECPTMGLAKTTFEQLIECIKDLSQS